MARWGLYWKSTLADLFAHMAMFEVWQIKIVPWCCWHAWPFLRLVIVWPVLHSAHATCMSERCMHYSVARMCNVAPMSHECCMHVRWILQPCVSHACPMHGMFHAWIAVVFSTCMHVWFSVLHAWTWMHACWCQNCAVVVFLDASCVDKKMCGIPFSLRFAVFRGSVTLLAFLCGRQHVFLAAIDVCGTAKDGCVEKVHFLSFGCRCVTYPFKIRTLFFQTRQTNTKPKFEQKLRGTHFCVPNEGSGFETIRGLLEPSRVNEEISQIEPVLGQWAWNQSWCQLHCTLQRPRTLPTKRSRWWSGDVHFWCWQSWQVE